MQGIITIAQLNNAESMSTGISSESNTALAFTIVILIALIVLIIILIRTKSIREKLKPILGYCA